MIDILVLNYNDAQTTIGFVESVKDYSCVNHILVVDNHSTDASFDKLKALENDKVIVVDSGKNKGYGAGNNFGIKYLKKHYDSEYILLSNPDVFISEKTLMELECFLSENTKYSIVAPFMLDSSGQKVYDSVFPEPSKMQYILSFCILARKYFCPFKYNDIECDQHYFKDVDVIPGSLFLMRTDEMLKYGMYDENIFLYCEEVVLAKKMKKNNIKTALLLKSTYVHHHSVSISKSFATLLSRQRLLIKSKLYVIKNYFEANFVDMFLARFVALYSLIEMYCVSVINNMKKRT